MGVGGTLQELKRVRALRKLLELDESRSYRYSEIVGVLVEEGLSSSYAVSLLLELANYYKALTRVDYGRYKINKDRIRELLEKMES